MIDERNNDSEHADRSACASSEDIDCALRDLTALPCPDAPGADPRDGELDEGLLVCGSCRSRLMYPEACDEHGSNHWYLELRCACCGGSEAALFDVGMLDALDRELQLAEDEIEADLECLTRANMADYVSRFVSALDAGAIEPEDFSA